MRGDALVGWVGMLLALQVAVAQAADVATPGPPFVVPAGNDGVQRATVVLDS
ncbi:MAG: hypothetical protein IT389_03500 [Nitrospira sp.]|nr:hypothetical protein [Nitrospira sp.]